jgi:predicted Zn finger-like uncharacterized protein
MAIQVQCPACNSLLKIDEKYLGKKVRCGSCKQVVLAAPTVAAPTVAAPTVVAPQEEPEPILLEVEEPSPEAIQCEPKVTFPQAKPPQSRGSKAPPPLRKERSESRPSRRRSSSPESRTWIVLAGAGFFLFALFAVVGLSAFFLLRRPDNPPPIAVINDPAPKDQVPDWKDPPPDVNPPPIFEEKKFEEKKFEEKKFEEKKFEEKKFEEKKFEEKKFEEKKFEEKNSDPPVMPAPAMPFAVSFPAVDASLLAIKPPTLDQEKTVRKLPSTATDLVVGGGGRFLLLNIPAQRQIAMFDANEGKIVHYFPAAEDGAMIAAGMTKLVVVYPGSNIVQRWDLLTRKRDVSAQLDVKGSPSAIAMGSASQGPLLVVVGDQSLSTATFHNLATFKSVPIDRDRQSSHYHWTPGYIRVSGTGNVFTSWGTGSPSGLNTFVLNGTTARSYNQHKSFGHLTPSPDGETIYTACGRFTKETAAIGQASENFVNYLVPATQGDFYVSLRLRDRFGDRFGEKKPVEAGNVAIHITADSRPLLRLTCDLGEGNRWDREPFGNDKRVQFIPDANLLVVLPESKDRLDVHRVNIEEMLNKSGIDFLYVTSRPNATAPRGSTFRYPIAVKSKKGGLKYKIESGPDGMKVDAAGTITWKIDAAQDLVEEVVLLTITDAAGQEIFHRFRLRGVPSAPGGGPARRDE